MIRTAILSFWHVHAPGHVKSVQNHPDMDLVAAWDENSQRGHERAKQFNIPYVEDLDELLARPDIDAVIVTTPTSLHHDVLIKAAKAGKHVFSDKVLAPTIKEANEIIAAVDAAKVVLVVAMPHLYYDVTNRIKEIIDSGVLGTLVNARLMNCHGMGVENTLPSGFFSAEEACGGALMDMCHIVYVLPFYFGKMPTSVFASFSYLLKREVEDSAVALYDFEDGSHATLESTFMTRGAPRLEIELNGTQGTVFFKSDSHPGGDGAPKDSSFLTRIGGDGTKFMVESLSKPSPTAISLWAQHILDGTRPDENIARALDLSRLIEAAYLSAAQGKKIELAGLNEGVLDLDQELLSPLS